MPGHTLPFSPQAVMLFGAGTFVAIAGVIGYRAWKLARTTPEERERRRREALAARGKITDATLVEIRDDVLFYSYRVRGVEYTASQDVGGLKEQMPSGVSLGIGPVSVKYHPRNPADSIVLAEQWSGLRARGARHA
jgi:hypothetical protein